MPQSDHPALSAVSFLLVCKAQISTHSSNPYDPHPLRMSTMSAEEHPPANPLIPKQSRTPYHISGKPEKQDLVDEYKGKNLDALRTPALIIDRAVFARNCAKLHELAKALGARFRAHVKSHKVSAPLLVPMLLVAHLVSRTSHIPPTHTDSRRHAPPTPVHRR